MGVHLCGVLWDDPHSAGFSSCLYGTSFSSRGTQSPAKHRYPQQSCLKNDQCGKDKGSSLDGSWQQSFLMKSVWYKHQTAAGLAWWAVSKAHAGLCWECFDMPGFCGEAWNQTNSEHTTFLLCSFLSCVSLPLSPPSFSVWGRMPPLLSLPWIWSLSEKCGFNF